MPALTGASASGVHVGRARTCAASLRKRSRSRAMASVGHRTYRRYRKITSTSDPIQIMANPIVRRRMPMAGIGSVPNASNMIPSTGKKGANARRPTARRQIERALTIESAT